jgi:plasmid stabilization system protein ParE
MPYILQYFDEVEADVHEAKAWYKEQKEGLEITFAAAIEKAIEHVLETPKAYSVRYKKVRIAHPKVFPYNIHFYINERNTTIVITAIVHSKRHPKIAKKRS